MSTPSPARAGHGAEEEERGTGTTPVKVGRGDEQERGSGTTPVKVGHLFGEERRATGSTPVKVVGRGADQEKGKGTTPAVKAGQGVNKEKSGTTTAPPVNVKAEAGGAGDASLINIKFHSQTAADEFFRVKRDVKLQRLIDMYCSKLSLNPKALVFLDPYGHRVQADRTPQEAGLEDGDEISVQLHQVGGDGAVLRGSQSSA